MLSKWLLYFLCFLVLWCTYGELDDALIEKDLYQVLGVSKDAELAAIKKAYRKLALEYHPDKGKPDQQPEKADKFRDIAEAYEVLSSRSTREEYDYKRMMLERLQARSGHAAPSRADEGYFDDAYVQGGFYGPGGAFFVFDGMGGYSAQDLFTELENKFREAEEDFLAFQRQYEDYYAQQYANDLQDDPFLGGFGHHHYHLSIVGPVMSQGQVLMPYDPVMTSKDGEYFVMLDGACSLGVYHGNPQETLLQMMELNDFSGLESIQTFKTESVPILQGRCFAAIDKVGILHIYSGSPYYPSDYTAVWSSNSKGSNTDYMDSHFLYQYILHIADDGELSVRRLPMQETFLFDIEDAHCMWSSDTCTKVIAAARKAYRNAMSTVRESPVHHFTDAIGSIHRAVASIVTGVFTAGHFLMHGLFDQVNRLLGWRDDEPSHNDQHYYARGERPSNREEHRSSSHRGNRRPFAGGPRGH